MVPCACIILPLKFVKSSFMEVEKVGTVCLTSGVCVSDDGEEPYLELTFEDAKKNNFGLAVTSIKDLELIQVLCKQAIDEFKGAHE